MIKTIIYIQQWIYAVHVLCTKLYAEPKFILHNLEDKINIYYVMYVHILFLIYLYTAIEISLFYETIISDRIPI